jgi:hypothetical protein
MKFVVVFRKLYYMPFRVAGKQNNTDWCSKASIAIGCLGHNEQIGRNSILDSGVELVASGLVPRSTEFSDSNATDFIKYSIMLGYHVEFVPPNFYCRLYAKDNMRTF